MKRNLTTLLIVVCCFILNFHVHGQSQTGNVSDPEYFTIHKNSGVLNHNSYITISATNREESGACTNDNDIFFEILVSSVNLDVTIINYENAWHDLKPGGTIGTAAYGERINTPNDNISHSTSMYIYEFPNDCHITGKLFFYIRSIKKHKSGFCGDNWVWSAWQKKELDFEPVEFHLAENLHPQIRCSGTPWDGMQANLRKVQVEVISNQQDIELEIPFNAAVSNDPATADDLIIWQRVLSTGAVSTNEILKPGNHLFSPYDNPYILPQEQEDGGMYVFRSEVPCQDQILQSTENINDLMQYGTSGIAQFIRIEDVQEIVDDYVNSTNLNQIYLYDTDNIPCGTEMQCQIYHLNYTKLGDPIGLTDAILNSPDVGNFMKIEKGKTEFYHLQPDGMGGYTEQQDAHMYHSPQDPQYQRRVCYTDLLDVNGNPLPFRKYRVKYFFKATVNIDVNNTAYQSTNTYYDIECSFYVDYTIFSSTLTSGNLTDIADDAYDSYLDYYSVLEDYMDDNGIPANTICDIIGEVILPFAEIHGLANDGAGAGTTIGPLYDDHVGDALYINKCISSPIRLLPELPERIGETQPFVDYLESNGDIAYRWVVRRANHPDSVISANYALSYAIASFDGPHILDLQMRYKGSDVTSPWNVSYSVFVFDSCEISKKDMQYQNQVQAYMNKQNIDSIVSLYQINGKETISKVIYRDTEMQQDVERNSLSGMEIQGMGNVSIYPNPNDGNVLTIGGDNIHLIQGVEIFDLSGKLLLSNSFPNGYNKENVLTEPLINGAYLVRIRTGNEIKVLKLIIQK